MLASTRCFYVIELQTDQGIVQVSTPFKIILGILAALVGLIVYNGIKAQSDDANSSSRSMESSAAEATKPPTATSQSAAVVRPESGWADSADVFMQRWNNEVVAAYRINDFHLDSVGKNTGTFLGGTVYAAKNFFLLTTYSRQTFDSMCTQAIEAALGVPFDDASAIETQTSSDPDRYLEVQGYTVLISSGGGALECWVSLKSH